ncbi:MAG TPA: hypothetical protein VF403_19650 [Kofleriaceae bacterium]
MKRLLVLDHDSHDIHEVILMGFRGCFGSDPSSQRMESVAPILLRKLHQRALAHFLHHERIDEPTDRRIDRSLIRDRPGIDTIRHYCMGGGMCGGM